MFGHFRESPVKKYQRKSQAYLSYLRISSHIYTRKTVNLPSLPCNVSYIMRHCKCKPVQASFSSCLGQLFSKIFDFFCVPLTLLVWLLNAWVSARLDMLGDDQDDQGKTYMQTRKSTSTISMPQDFSNALRITVCHTYASLCLPSLSLPCNASHTMRHYWDILQVQASASKLQQLPSPTAFENLQLLLRFSDAPGLTP